ncbi:MAG: 50S ribosomal protein L29 [Aestuariivita sp.]|nr:50S ribosomal protein L29 [Aestuariivita sp.]
MNASELRDKTLDQLQDELLKLKKEAFNLRFQRANEELESPARMREVRRDVARVKTIIKEKVSRQALEGET